jgi:hypothetical protein
MLAALMASIANVVVAPSAVAQTVSEPIGRVQIGVGFGWLGGAAFGEQPADLRAASGGPYRLFDSETNLGSTGSFEARVGIGLSRRFGVEGRFAFSKPELQTLVSSDAETTGSLTIAESIDHYVFDGGVVVRFAEWDRVTPFASAGGGYVRQLHEGQALISSTSVVASRFRSSHDRRDLSAPRASEPICGSICSISSSMKEVNGREVSLAAS